MEESKTDSFPDKQYFAIGEVAKIFNITVSNVRFWEKEFDILKPKKNKKGDRFFTKKDMEYLKLIHHLVKEKGYTLEGARKKIMQTPDEQVDKLQIIASLKEIRSFLSSLKDHLDKGS